MGKDSRLSGSITVYLVLVFVLILSLISVSLEAAASATLRSKAEAALASGMESALADYYRPLFDEYGIFALDLGYGEKRANTAELTSRVSRYARLNSDGCEISSCGVERTTLLTGDGGEHFIEQAVDAEEITLVEGLIESLGEMLGLISGQEEVNSVLARKTELEEELAAIDMYTAELMALIDGVEIDTGLILEGKGTYRIRSTFVKRFMAMDVNRISVGINSPKLFSKLESEYVNPVEKTSELAALAEEYAGLLAEAGAIEAELAPLKEELSSMMRELAEAEEDDPYAEGDEDAEEEPSEEDSPEEEPSEEDAYIAELRKEVNVLSERIAFLEEGHTKAFAKAAVAGRKCADLAGELRVLFRETVSCLKFAEETAQAALEATEDLAGKVETFEELLVSMEGIIDEETLAELGSTLSSMKEYVGLEGKETATDFGTIRATALSDRQLLDGNMAVEKLQYPEETPEAVLKWGNELKILADRMTDFSYDGMFFDYSSFETMDAEDAVLEGINGFVLEPLSDIWLDYMLGDAGNLSEAELKTFLLPKLEGREETGGIAADPDESFLAELCGVMKEGIGHIYDKAVLCMYMHDHFNSYVTGDRMKATVMKYEQEYLICGNTNDRVNLAGALAQILLLRMVSSGVFVFTDSEITAKADSAAQAVAGFTGLPFLVMLVKYMILTVWAFEQAVVETAAVIRGKKVPIITSKKSFCVEMSELLSFSKELAAKKADCFAEGSPSLSYEEYLLALLLTRQNETLAGRALGLIQENLRYCYGDNFLICNCIVGFEAEAVFSSEAMYLTVFPMPCKDRDIRGYSVSVSGRKSY